MKKIKKSFVFILSCLMLWMIGNINIKAAGPMDGMIIDGSLLTSEESATDTKPLLPENSIDEGVIPDGNYLSSGTVSIANEGGGTVYISGQTCCYKTCDNVKVCLYLQKLSNGSWHTIQSQPYTTYNTYFAQNGIYFAVQKGYYYRVRGGHSATKGSSTESTTTCSNGIYIG